MFSKFISYLSKYYPLSAVIEGRLQQITQLHSYPPKTELLREGEIASYACVVLKGLVRAYYLKDGNDITSRFMDEGFVITSWISFYTRQPGYEFIETLESAEIGCVHYNDLQNLYNDFTEFNITGRKLTEHFFFLAEQRTYMLRKHSAEEKYVYFINMYPTLLQRVPLRHIASYLGISEETLSRVRSKYHKEH